jgi:hypothetical protein
VSIINKDHIFHSCYCLSFSLGFSITFNTLSARSTSGAIWRLRSKTKGQEQANQTVHGEIDALLGDQQFFSREADGMKHERSIRLLVQHTRNKVLFSKLFIQQLLPGISTFGTTGSMQPVTSSVECGSDLRLGLTQHEGTGDEALLEGPSIRDLTERSPRSKG